jgi:hypothetical protein
MRFLDASTRLGQFLVDGAHVSLYPPAGGQGQDIVEARDNTDSRERDEDAAWRDLVARFDAPPITQQPVPWPECEDVLPPRLPETKEPPAADDTREAEQAWGTDETREPRRAEETRETGRANGIPGIAEAEGLPEVNDPTVIPGVPSTDGLPGAEGVEGTHGVEGTQGTHGVEGTRGTHGVEGTRGAHGVKGIRGFDDEGIRGALDPEGSREPDVIEAARRRRRTSARSIRAHQAPPDPTPADDEEHYVPPAPPPLPTLDSIAKGAWAALFGGPAFLVAATAAHWALSGFAVFCAVAAFVTGFVILVLRMNEPGPGGPDDRDDGAVV